MNAVSILHGDVEIAHEEAGEVILCKLEEQSVFVRRVRLVGYHECESGKSFVRQFAYSCRVVVGQHLRTSFPNIVKVELTALETLSFADALHYHARHLSHSALRPFLHHRVHILKTTLSVALVKLRQSAYKDKLVAVGAERESAVGYAHIATHLRVTSCLEGIVRRGIQRVFHVYAELGVLHEVRIR